MFRVAIVGDHGSGKTTFLGLLYAALVSAGSGQEDRLRFHVAYESLDEITALFQRLMSGGFPDGTIKEGLHELRLELDASASGRGILRRIGSRKGTSDHAAAVHFSLPGSLDETSPGLQHGSTFGTGRWREALDADVLILMVDATKLAAKDAAAKARPLAAYDGRLEALFLAVQRWRSRGGRPLLHPVFVLSKFDAVRPDVLKAASLEAAPPIVGKDGPRATYGKALLEPNLPRCLALLEGPVGKKLRFAPPAFVYSRVQTETRDAGQPERIKLRRTASGGWEPDCAQDEYVAFLGRIARLSSEVRD